MKELDAYPLQLRQAQFFEAGFISRRNDRQFWHEPIAVINIALLILRRYYSAA